MPLPASTYSRFSRPTKTQSSKTIGKLYSSSPRLQKRYSHHHIMHAHSCSVLQNKICVISNLTTPDVLLKVCKLSTNVNVQHSIWINSRCAYIKQGWQVFAAGGLNRPGRNRFKPFLPEYMTKMQNWQGFIIILCNECI